MRSACSGSTASGAASSLLLFLGVFRCLLRVWLVVCPPCSLDFLRDRCVCCSDLGGAGAKHVGRNGGARIPCQPLSRTTDNTSNSTRNNCKCFLLMFATLHPRFAFQFNGVLDCTTKPTSEASGSGTQIMRFHSKSARLTRVHGANADDVISSA